MRLSYFFIAATLLIVSHNLKSQKHVVTHSRTTITTDPSKGTNSYFAWGEFPGKDVPIRKIIMHVTLGTPDSISTAHWDYCDHIRIRKAGGKNGKDMKYEIGRMLTPYGSIYSKGWDFTWSVDVTDFSMLLRDSVEIEYEHTGYEPKTVGWALTIDFEFMAGPPAIVPLSIQPMWDDQYPYGDPENPFEDILKKITYTKTEGAVLNRLRIQHTGHGMDSPNGCSEFCNRWREIYFNDKQIQHKELWKNCGDNPLYPQGGTWIFDRALWCPGDLQVADQIDVHPANGENSFRIAMEPYTATKNIQARENISSVLIQYGAPVSKNDVAVEEIIVPNSDKFYNRENPACFNPVIKIRNLGSKPLKSLLIDYKTEGSMNRTYKWKGDLGFNEVVTITIPTRIFFKDASNKFLVQCHKPNGKKDAWVGDNSLISKFEAPEEMPEDFIIQYKTNNTPEENSIFILNHSGDTVYIKPHEGIKPDTLYTDTIHLPSAPYEMYLTDEGGNGLEFWFMVKQGVGYLRLLDYNGNLIHLFEKDCGDGQKFAFNTSTNYKPSEIPIYDFFIYPKRIKDDKFSLYTYFNNKVEMEVTLMTIGNDVQKYTYYDTPGGEYKFDISHLPKGRYIVEVHVNGKLEYKTRINK